MRKASSKTKANKARQTYRGIFVTNFNVSRETKNNKRNTIKTQKQGKTKNAAKRKRLGDRMRLGAEPGREERQQRGDAAHKLLQNVKARSTQHTGGTRVSI